MSALQIILIILASYVVHVFLCRAMNIWMMKNQHRDRTVADYYMAVGAWFIPLIGLLYIGVFTVRLAILMWKETSSGRWFMEGGDGFNGWVKIKKWFTEWKDD